MIIILSQQVCRLITHEDGNTKQGTNLLLARSTCTRLSVLCATLILYYFIIYVTFSYMRLNFLSDQILHAWIWFTSCKLDVFLCTESSIVKNTIQSYIYAIKLYLHQNFFFISTCQTLWWVSTTIFRNLWFKSWIRLLWFSFWSSSITFH